MAQTGKLILCPTPLGNLGDVTQRTLEAFKTSTVVCCEDTRVTGKLLAALGISKRLERLDEATLATQTETIVGRIAAGEVIAYATDAGMPGVSDPGMRLVDAARTAGVTVEVLPGPTAVTTAYVASGFTAQSFYFGAFLPRKTAETTRLLEALKPLDAVLVFYESPKRLVASLQIVAQVFPYRRVAVCRELTKVYEEVVRDRAPEVLTYFAKREASGGVKGEIVIVIEAAVAEEKANAHTNALQAAKTRLAELQAQGTLSKKDMVKTLCAECGIARNVAYELVHTRS